MEFLSTALIVVITAALTASLSMQRFKKERHWEQKSHAYTEIRVAIHEISKSLNKFLSNCSQEDLQTENEYLSSLLDEYKKGLYKVEESLITGKYFISEEAWATVTAITFYEYSKFTENSLEKLHKEKNFIDRNVEYFDKIAIQELSSSKKSNIEYIAYRLFISLDDLLYSPAKAIANMDHPRRATSERPAPDPHR